MPLSRDEHHAFSESIKAKQLPELRALFNELTAINKGASGKVYDDHTRVVAGEKARIVKSHINLRNNGGAQG